MQEGPGVQEKLLGSTKRAKRVSSNNRIDLILVMLVGVLYSVIKCHLENKNKIFYDNVP